MKIFFNVFQMKNLPHMCDLSFWPQNYHITNMSQLAMWIAFLRFRTVLLGVIIQSFHVFRSIIVKKADSIVAVARYVSGVRLLCKRCITALTLQGILA